MAEERCVLVVTNRLGVFPVTAALALKDAGFIPVVALMGAARKKRGSILETVAEYGFGYTIERVADAVVRMVWLAGFRKESRQVQVREIAAHDWTALCRLADGVDAAAVISASFGYRFPAEVISRQKVLLNLHPAPLPGWRGADPIYWMIRKRERVFGVTLHHVAERFDEGAVYFSAPAFPRIRCLRGFVELSLSRVIRKHLGEWVSMILRGGVVPKAQECGTYWPLPTRENQRRLL